MGPKRRLPEGNSFIVGRDWSSYVDGKFRHKNCNKISVADPLTFEWTDGLIAMATRKFSRDTMAGSPDDHRTNSEMTTASKVGTGNKKRDIVGLS